MRLLRPREFRKVYQEGRRRSTRVCLVYYRSNNLSRFRVGITTPKAIGNAVIRNRVRRRLREVIRLNQAALPPGWDVVLNPRAEVAGMPFPNLAQEILHLLPSRPPGASAAKPPVRPGI